MSMLLRAALTGSSVVGATIGLKLAKDKIESKYAPTTDYPDGSKSVVVGGREYHLLGWWGAAKSTMPHVSIDRELYFGPKKVAQGYAKTRAGDHDTASVAMVISEKAPEARDFGVQRFEGGFDPLSPTGMHRIGVKVVYVEDVNPDNEIGLIASMRRMIVSR